VVSHESLIGGEVAKTKDEREDNNKMTYVRLTSINKVTSGNFLRGYISMYITLSIFITLFKKCDIYR